MHCWIRTFLVLALTSPAAFAQASSASYVFTTFAGRAGLVGNNDGTSANARFNRPWGIALDRSGNVYVAEASNHTVRKITADGTVSLLAGLASVPGSVDGTGD